LHAPYRQRRDPRRASVPDDETFGLKNGVK
jgi:hypothetical protein